MLFIIACTEIEQSLIAKFKKRTQRGRCCRAKSFLHLFEDRTFPFLFIATTEETNVRFKQIGTTQFHV
jgi:hypothetical protein